MNRFDLSAMICCALSFKLLVVICVYFSFSIFPKYFLYTHQEGLIFAKFQVKENLLEHIGFLSQQSPCNVMLCIKNKWRHIYVKIGLD